METNIRRIITNLKDYRTRDLYEIGRLMRSLQQISFICFPKGGVEQNNPKIQTINLG